ncbi:MAG: GyrI-like domain-containing protein [Chloroflexota bacterium]
MEPTFVTKPAFTVVGLKIKTKNEQGEIPALWQKLGPQMCNMENVVDPHTAYGICDAPDESGAFNYLAGCKVSQPGELAEGLEAWDIPEQKYAVFKTTLPGMHQVYEHIYGTWLPQSGFQTSEVMFELYDKEFDPRIADSGFYIYVPVK